MRMTVGPADKHKPTMGNENVRKGSLTGTCVAVLCAYLRLKGDNSKQLICFGWQKYNGFPAKSICFCGSKAAKIQERQYLKSGGGVMPHVTRNAGKPSAEI